MTSPRRAAWTLVAASALLPGCTDDPAGPHGRRVPIQDLLAEPIAVSPNPSGVAPLTAEATIRTHEETTVEVRTLGGEPMELRIPRSATEHAVPILGLHAGRENRVEVRVSDGLGRYGLDTLSLVTDPVPEFFADIEIVVANPERMEQGWNLSSFSVGDGGVYRSFPMIFDTEGAIRWYLDLSSFGEIVFMVERLRNGNLLFGAGESVYEYDMLGREVNRWEFPGYRFHHDVVEKPDGNLLVAVDNRALETVEDHALELDRGSGAVVRVWDLRPILDVSRRALFGSDTDWFHMNSIWYDEDDDALILSGRHQGVVKVTAGNELVWILAPHEGWGPAGVDGTGHETADFLLTAVDDDGNAYPDAVQLGTERAPDFDWPWGQHAAMLLPNGNLLLFDNGIYRNFTFDPPLFSRAAEYAIDEAEMTVRQVWQYGEERGSEYFSPIISDVDHLPSTGNRLVMPGIAGDSDPRAYVTEVTYPAGDVVFEARISFKDLLATAEGGFGQFDLVYRSERLPLYPETN